MAIIVRPASETDLVDITAIYAESVLNGMGTYELDPPTELEMARRFAHITGDGFPYVVAVNDEGNIVGYAYASAFRTRAAYDWLCEDSIYVAPEARGRNVGRLLLDELLRRTTALGYRQMVAVIGGASPASIAVHKAAGFEYAGLLKATGLKHGQWLDTVFMQIALGEGADTLPARPPGDFA